MFNLIHRHSSHWRTKTVSWFESNETRRAKIWFFFCFLNCWWRATKTTATSQNRWIELKVFRWASKLWIDWNGDGACCVAVCPRDDGLCAVVCMKNERYILYRWARSPRIFNDDNNKKTKLWYFHVILRAFKWKGLALFDSIRFYAGFRATKPFSVIQLLCQNEATVRPSRVD